MSAVFKLTIQSDLKEIDLSKALYDGQDQAVNLNSAERITLNLADYFDETSQGVITVDGQANDTVILKGLAADLLDPVKSQANRWVVHENGYWKYDLDEGGRPDLLISDAIHRIVLG